MSDDHDVAAVDRPGVHHHGPEAKRLCTVSLQVTASFAVLSVMTYLFAERLDTVFAVSCSLLFISGMFLLALGLWNGAQRSRIEDVSMAGLLAIDRRNVSPSARTTLWSSVAIQIVIAVVFGVLRPFTEQAFGLLVPAFGLGIAALWGSRFAIFDQRRR